MINLNWNWRRRKKNRKTAVKNFCLKIFLPWKNLKRQKIGFSNNKILKAVWCVANIAGESAQLRDLLLAEGNNIGEAFLTIKKIFIFHFPQFICIECSKSLKLIRILIQCS